MICTKGLGKYKRIIMYRVIMLENRGFEGTVWLALVCFDFWSMRIEEMGGFDYLVNLLKNGENLREMGMQGLII